MMMLINQNVHPSHHHLQICKWFYCLEMQQEQMKSFQGGSFFFSFLHSAFSTHLLSPPPSINPLIPKMKERERREHFKFIIIIQPPPPKKKGGVGCSGLRGLHRALQADVEHFAGLRRRWQCACSRSCICYRGTEASSRGERENEQRWCVCVCVCVRACVAMSDRRRERERRERIGSTEKRAVSLCG